MSSHQWAAGTSEWKSQSQGSGPSPVTSRRRASPEFAQLDRTTPSSSERGGDPEGVPGAVRVVADSRRLEGVPGGNPRERVRHQDGDPVLSGDDRPAFAEAAPGRQNRLDGGSQYRRDLRRRRSGPGPREPFENRSPDAGCEIQRLQSPPATWYGPRSRARPAQLEPESPCAIRRALFSPPAVVPRRHTAGRIRRTCGRMLAQNVVGLSPVAIP